MTQTASGKTHKTENFPVATLLARRHRGPVMDFYRFVRAGDDIADHPTLPPLEKLRRLDALAADLDAESPRDPLAAALRRALKRRGLPSAHALDLLAAFRLDVCKTRYRDLADLYDYCRLSAMPVGRFVLDLHGESRALWPANDALCAALQIINHLQDCGDDYRALDRAYLPQALLKRRGATVAMLGEPAATPQVRAVIDDLLAHVRALLTTSAELSPRIRNLRLALNVAAIQRLAEDLVRRLSVGDPLAGAVRPPKTAFAVIAARGMGDALVRRAGARFLSPDATRGPSP